MGNVYNRRQFIRKQFQLVSVSWVATVIWGACNADQRSQKKETIENKSDPCEDLSGVSEKDIDIRNKAAYVTKSPLPDKLCSNCNLYIPPAAGRECGGCMLFKGPVYPGAYCIYWATKG